MPGYRRVISYIYVYEKGERRGNCGFVKLDARDGEYRFTVQLRKGFQRQGIYKLYLYVPEHGELRGIHLGELKQAAGILEWKGSIRQEVLYSMTDYPDQIQGILIEGPGQIQYAAQWEDTPINVERFRVYPPAGKKPGQAEPVREAGTADKQPGESAGQRETAENRVIREEQPLEVARRQPAQDSEELSAIEPSVQETKQDLAGEAAEIEKEALVEERAVPERADLAGEATEIEKEALAEERAVPERTDLAGEAAEIEKEALAEGTAAPERADSDGERAEIEKADLAEEAATAERMDSRQEKWEYLTRHFPVQRLFQSEGPPMACIRIGPRDLQRLPRDHWVLGNNSFLFHGYYQFRHLLLCRQEENGQPVFYLGVPGVYNERERMMAELFGFGEFRRSRNMGNRNGNFGYWFRKLEEA